MFRRIWTWEVNQTGRVELMTGKDGKIWPEELPFEALKEVPITQFTQLLSWCLWCSRIWGQETACGYFCAHTAHTEGTAVSTLYQFTPVRKIHCSYFLTKCSPYTSCRICGWGHFNLGSLNTKFYGRYAVLLTLANVIGNLQVNSLLTEKSSNNSFQAENCWNSELILFTKIIIKIRFGFNPLNLVSLYRNGTFENLMI